MPLREKRESNSAQGAPPRADAPHPPGGLGLRRGVEPEELKRHRSPLLARSQHIFLPDATYYLSTTAISHGLAFVHFCSSSYHIFPPFLDDKAFVDNTRFFPTRRIPYLRLRFFTDSPSTNSPHLLPTSSHLPSTTKLSSTTPATSTSLLPHFLQFIPRRLLLDFFLDAFSPFASILRYPGLRDRLRCLCKRA